MEENKSQKFEIDYFRLLKILKADKRKTMIYCIAFGIFGIIVAFSIPRIYKTTVMLAPESSGGSSLTSNISSLASMVGMDMNFGDNNDAIYPEIYPDLMKSADFTVSLFPINVKSKDGKINMSYYDYLFSKQKMAWWDYPRAWIAKLKKHFRKKEEGADDGKINPFMLTRDQYDVAKYINGNIDCTVDKKTSVITIVVTDQDPLISASMADSVKDRLQVFITNYRTNKARNDLAYMEKLFDEAKAQYVKARQKYASFSDANSDLILESVRSAQEDLENDMQLKYNIYTQVAEQLQLAKAKVQEKTPAFTVVQSASVPVKHSNKPKILILALFLFLGWLFRVCMLAYKHRKELVHITGEPQTAE